MFVYFDIDSTLFTTALFKKTRLDEHLVEVLGVLPEQLQQLHDAYYQTIEKGTDFNYHEYARFMAKHLDHSNLVDVERQVVELFETKSVYENMIYPEVISVLESLRERGIPMGIYSEGFTDFQTNKIRFTGIFDYFDPTLVHVARRKKQLEVIQKLQTPALIVDDKQEYLTDLPDGITPIWINRTSKEVHQTIHTVHSLEEVVKLLD